jgi:hypothetical protein
VEAQSLEEHGFEIDCLFQRMIRDAIRDIILSLLPHAEDGVDLLEDLTTNFRSEGDFVEEPREE